MTKFDEAYFIKRYDNLTEKMLDASEKAPARAAWVFGQRIDSKRDIINGFRANMRTLWDAAKLRGIEVTKCLGPRPDEKGDEQEPNSLS